MILSFSDCVGKTQQKGLNDSQHCPNYAFTVMVLWLLVCLWHVGQCRTSAYSQPFAFLYKNLKLLDNLLKRLFVYFTLFNDQDDKSR